MAFSQQHAPLHRGSSLRLWLMVCAAVVLPAAVVLVQPKFFDNAADALNLGPRIGALAYFMSVATTEEAAKAAAIGVAGLRRSPFSWFWIACAAAVVTGATEVALQHVLYFGENGYPSNVVPLAFANIRTVTGHAALSLICVSLARAMGGKAAAWLGAILVAGLIHSLVNLGRGGLFGTPPGGAITYLLGTWVLFAGVILFAFVYRRRFDWRS